jgi:uncharacterized protein
MSMTTEHIQEDTAEKADNIDGSYVVTNDESAVYITVHPPKGEGSSVKENDIIEALKNCGVTNVARHIIVGEIKEPSGQPIKVADFSKAPEPKIQVSVTRDRMEASLQVDLPHGCRSISVEEIMEKIKASGVVFGINGEAAEEAHKHHGYRTTCAKGQPQINGKDAAIKYCINTENKGRPAELENGRVDYKDLNLFITVHEGQLLAEKIPPTAGINGTDVLGQPVLAKPGKDKLMPAGKNVQVVDNTIISNITGQLLIANNKINVMPSIEINGDVDLSTGNIEFEGSVTVRGSVQEGFSVKAEGNVEVCGIVSGCIIEGKSVLIRTGIQGMNKGYVKAQENVVAKFIENATVIAGEDILVNDSVLNSRISAAKRVIVEGKRGLIVGGKIMAGEEIRAKVIGTQASRTELEVGVNPMLREEYQNIRRNFKKVEVSLDKAQKALTILKSMDQSSMSQNKKEMLLRLTKTRFQLIGQSENMRKRIAEIERTFEEMKFGRIKVSDVMFAGVNVVVGTQVKYIRKALKSASLYAEDDEVKVGAYND